MWLLLMQFGVRKKLQILLIMSMVSLVRKRISSYPKTKLLYSQLFHAELNGFNLEMHL